MKVKQPPLTLIFACLGLSEGVRRYQLNLTYEWDKQGTFPWLSTDDFLKLTLRADGHGRPTFLINSNTPGPVLVVNEEETLEAVVNNQMPIETTIHWYHLVSRNVNVDQALINPIGMAFTK